MSPLFARGLLALLGAVIGAALGYFAITALLVAVHFSGAFVRINDQWWNSFYDGGWLIATIAGALLMAWRFIRWHQRRGLVGRTQGAVAESPNRAP